MEYIDNQIAAQQVMEQELESNNEGVEARNGQGVQVTPSSSQAIDTNKQDAQASW